MRVDKKKEKVLTHLEEILSALENDPEALKRLSWIKPWSNPPRNLAGRQYNGGNVHILNFESIGKGYKHNRWGTFNQFKKYGASIIKGSSATPIYYYNVRKYTKEDENGEEKEFTYYVFKYFNLFNIEQTTLDIKRLPGVEYKEIEYTTPERIRRGYCDNDGPDYQESGDRAFYRPGEDLVCLPPRETVHSSAEYASTLYHELVHSTGHGKRLDRGFSLSRGGEGYALEELVAETGALLLCDRSGITPDVNNFKAYIASWLQAVRSDQRYKTFSALSKAEKAVDYILGER